MVRRNKQDAVALAGSRRAKREKWAFAPATEATRIRAKGAQCQRRRQSLERRAYKRSGSPSVHAAWLTGSRSEPSSQPVSRFLRLPGELRNRIYECFVPAGTIRISIASRAKAFWPAQLRPLLQINRGIRKEALSYMLAQSLFRIRCFWARSFHDQFEGAELQGIRVLRLDIMPYCLGNDRLPKARQIARLLEPLCGRDMLQSVSIYVYNFVDWVEPPGETFSEEMMVKLRKVLKKDGQEVRVEGSSMRSPSPFGQDWWTEIDRQDETDVAVEADSGESSMSELDLVVAVEMELRNK